MKSIIKNRLVTILSLILAVCMLVATVSLIGKTSAKAEYQTEIATQVEGASVRIAEYEKSGIKFKAQLKKSDFETLYNKYNGNVKAGMIIVPTDYINAAGGSTFTKLAALGKDISSATVDSFALNGDYYEYTISLVNLKPTNYARDFEGIVFIEITSDEVVEDAESYGGKYYLYADRNESYARTIYEVAKDAFNDRIAAEDADHKNLIDGKYSALDADGLAIAKTYMDGVTEIILDGGKPAAYSSEFYAANTNVLTNDTEAYLMGEHKIVVYNGEKVTAPYTDTENGITVKTVTTDSTYANGAYSAIGGYPDRLGGANFNALNAQTPGYVAFDGAYGVETFVEYEFTGNNMPIVTLFSNRINNSITRIGGNGIVVMNGQVVNNSGTAATGDTNKFMVFGPNRLNAHYWAQLALASLVPATTAETYEFTQAGLKAETTYRYVVGTKIVHEDVNGADGLAYAEGAEKDGVLEEALYIVAELYNAETNAKIAEWSAALVYKYDNAKSPADVADKYLVASDLADGYIVAHGGMKGADAEENVLNTTFKLAKAPYKNHIHDFYILNTDANNHWYECDCGAVSEKAEHLGGTATHTEKAECEVCGAAYGDLRANYDVDDVTLVQMANKSATEVITADKGALTFSPEQATPSQTNASTIVLKKQYTNEFIKVGFTAQADFDATNKNNLDKVLGLSLEYRTSSTTSVNGLDNFGIGILGNTNYLILYTIHSGNYYNYPTGRNSADVKYAELVAGEQYYLIGGISTDSDGNNTLYFSIVSEDGTVIVKSYMDQAALDIALTNKSTQTKDKALPESGFWTINSWATSERTVSWETISEAQAMYHINGGKGVEGLTVSGNVANWTDYDGANSYKVKVNDGEWVTADTATYTMTDLKAFDTYNVTVKAVCDGFETNETTTQFTYTPSGIQLVNVDSIKADGEATATSGTVTVTADTVSAIGFTAADATDFIKVGFTATGAAVEAMSINFRQASVAASWSTGWSVAPNGTHGMMLNYGGNTYMNRINGHGLYTSVIGGNGIEAKSDFTEGNEYAYMVGITGTGTDKVLHFMIIDETNAVVMRYVTWTWAQISEYRDTTFSGWTLVDIAESGAFVLNFTAAVTDTTVSYEIIDAADVLKYANYGAIETAQNKITHSGATITWPAVANATNYLVSVNGGAWETVNTNSYTIANPVSFANYEVAIRANLGYYAATGAYSFIYTPANMSTINVASISGNASATSGNITIKSSIESGMNWQNTAAFSLDQQFTDEFIKIGFTALSGDGTAVNLADAMGFAVGFRRSSTAQTNPVLADWMFKANNDTNYGYFYNKAANAFAYGHGGTSIGDKAKLKLVAGAQYYFVLGVSGAVEGTTDNRTMYAFWLDASSNLIGGFSVTMTKFVSVRANATMAENGGMSIHSYVSELNVSYEIIDSATALDYLG